MPKPADKVVRVGNVAAAPGELKFGSLTCASLPDATPVSLPLLVMNGKADGPVLLLTGCMHGLEVGGIEVIRRVMREVLDPVTLRGAVIAAPILNPFAYCAGRMNTPQDEYNLNRVFPGGPGQLLSHRLADVIVNQIVTKTDYLIDLHSNVQPSIPFAIIRHTPDEAVNAAGRKMADAFGITTVRMVLKFEQHRTGTMSDWALAHGIASIVIELVDSRRIHDPSVTMGVRGIRNVMKVLGMLDGKVEPQTEMVVHRGNLTRMELTAAKGGLVHRGKEAGEAVRKGDLLAAFYDPYGNVVDELRSPVDGYVLAYPMRESQALATGNMVIFLAFEPSE